MVNVAEFPGTNVGEKIIAAIAGLDGPGIVDVTTFTGGQSITSPIIVPASVTILLGNAVLTFSGSGCFILRASALIGQSFGAHASDYGTVFRVHSPGISPIVLYDNAQGVIVENIGFDGSNRTEGLASAIVLDDGTVSRCYFRNLSFTYWRGTLIYLNNATDSHY
jgi:hypothetical protein